MNELQFIEDIIEQQTGVRPSKEPLKLRKQKLVKLRQLAMYCGRKYGRISSKKAGKFYDKDHATALHACKVVMNTLETNDPEYSTLFKNIISDVRLAVQLNVFDKFNNIAQL